MIVTLWRTTSLNSRGSRPPLAAPPASLPSRPLPPQALGDAGHTRMSHSPGTGPHVLRAQSSQTAGRLHAVERLNITLLLPSLPDDDDPKHSRPREQLSQEISIGCSADRTRFARPEEGVAGLCVCGFWGRKKTWEHFVVHVPCSRYQLP